MQLFTSVRILVDMSTTTPAITAASFEKVFVCRRAASITHIQRHTPPDEHLVAGEKYQDLATWREIAWKAFEKKRLGNSLRRAIVPISSFQTPSRRSRARSPNPDTSPR